MRDAPFLAHDRDALPRCCLAGKRHGKATDLLLPGFCRTGCFPSRKQSQVVSGFGLWW